MNSIPAKISVGPRLVLWFSAVTIALVGLAGTAPAASASHPPRFEVQDNASIRLASLTLATELGLTPAQSTTVESLMRTRASRLLAKFDAADAALREKAELLLTGAQRSQVPWPAMRWTSLDQWTHHLPNVTREQAVALAPLIKARNDAIRAALVSCQAEYIAALDGVLSPAQQRALASASDTVIYIPMR